MKNRSFFRVFPIVLILSILISGFACSESQTPESIGEKIFQSLSRSFDVGLNYLRRRQELWNALIDHADKAFPEDNRWFWNNYVLTYEIKTSQPVIRFFLSNFGDAGKTADQTIDDIYEKMFMPLYQRFGETDEGYRNACAAFIQMIFYGDTNVQREELSQIKDEIKKLAQDFPEYEYVSPIKMFYQECLQLNDYIADSSDDYSQTKEQISNYEQRRRELRSLFDFDFSWTDHPADTIASLNGIYFEFFHQEEETAYQAAEAEAKRGNLFEALELYTKLGSYKESAVRAETIKAELYIKAQEYEQAGDLRSASRYMNAVHPYKDSGERLDYYRSVLGYPMTIKGYKAIGSLFFEDRAAVQNKEGKWGFINTAGKLVIDCQYDAVSSFWRGYSTVTRKDGEKEEKGAIDPTGKMVIPFGMYEDLGSFSEGLCSAKLNGKWGFADTSGNMVIPARYDSAVYFSEGIAAVKTGKLWGAVNNKGETVFEPQFNRDFIFYGGIADTMKGGRFIYINTAGEQLFGTDYANTRPFGEQLAATMQKASDTDYRFIDTAGKTVFTLECGNAGTFQEGYVWFSRENKFGVADRTGKIIIAPEYQDLYFFGKGFHDGLIAAKKDDKWGIITPQNRTVIPIEYDKIYPFNEGFCIAIKGDEITVFDEP